MRPKEFLNILFPIFQQDGRFDQILATEDPLKMPTNLARDLSESPFLGVEESISQKLYNIWYSLHTCICMNLFDYIQEKCAIHIHL